MRLSSTNLVRFVALAAAASTTACFALYGNKTTAQCHSEDDCRSRGPEFADTTCGPDAVCVPVPESAKACSTNQECSDKNGGAAYRCVPQTHQCVSILTPECTRIFGEKQDYLNDSAIFVGLETLPDENGVLMEDGAELARFEIRLALQGGLPPAPGGAAKRPIVIVDCADEPNARGQGSNDAANRAALHLVDELQVSAVVGPFTPPTILSVVPTVNLANNVTTLLPASAIPQVVRQFNDKGILFQLSGLDIETEYLLPDLMQNYLIPRVYADGIANPGDPIKVHMIRSGEPQNVYQGNWVIDNVKWNSKSAHENQADGNYLESFFGDPSDTVNYPDAPVRITKAIAAGLQYHPHIVFINANPGLAPTTIIPYDAQWPAGVPKPLFVSLMQSWTNNIVGALGNRDSLRQRYYGMEQVAPQFDQPHYDQFVVAIRDKFPELLNQNIGIQAYQAYDAVYMIAYSVIAAGATELVGTTIGSNVHRLQGGPPIQTGTNDLPAGIAALQQPNGTISLNGITGPLAFDAKGARPPFNSRVFCVSAKNGVASAVTRPGYTWDAVNMKPVGALPMSGPPCP